MELASWLAVTEEDVAAAMAIPDLLHSPSLDELPVGQDGEETESLGERIGADDPRFEAAELRVLLRRAMEGLPSRLREIIERRYFEGMTEHEVARLVGVSQMQISRLERRALAWLRQELREAFGPVTIPLPDSRSRAAVR
jgi:RNA polymerase sigma-B factor